MIKISKLSKDYGTKTVLDQVTYSFPNNGIVSVVGKSGSGKSTLMNILAGFDENYKGKITIGNQELSKLNQKELANYRKDYVGFVFQDYYLLEGYTVLENILMTNELKSTSKVADKRRALEILKSIGIEEKKDEYIESLSGGQKQRVAIARVLLKNPKIIFADEPTGALDDENAAEIMKIFREIGKEKLIVMVTHSEELAQKCDNVVKIENQKIIEMKQNENNKQTSKFDEFIITKPEKINYLNIAKKNIKVNKKWYQGINIIFSIGIMCLIMSIFSQAFIDYKINEFEQKNPGLTNGFITIENTNNSFMGETEKEPELDYDEILSILASNQKIENVYSQYILEDVMITIGNKSEKLNSKYPTAKADKTFSYGRLPKKNANEIALTPNIAGKFTNDITNLIGETLHLKVGEYEEDFTISGIYNDQYADFIIDSNSEQEVYDTLQLDDKMMYSISYDVDNFDDVPEVTKFLNDNGIKAVTGDEAIISYKQSFEKIEDIFNKITLLLIIIVFSLVVLILLKIQKIKYKFIGVQIIGGANKQMLRKIFIIENILSIVTILGLTMTLLFVFEVALKLMNLEISFQYSTVMTIIIVANIILFGINFGLNELLINKPFNKIRQNEKN